MWAIFQEEDTEVLINLGYIEDPNEVTCIFIRWVKEKNVYHYDYHNAYGLSIFSNSFSPKNAYEETNYWLDQ